MAWLVAGFGAVLVIAGFDGYPVFDMSDKWAVAVGATFVLAGLFRH